ncbi:hypothetical protein Hbal_1231 [Hirschia baltica ATCC 49814]|uniref:DUF6456 domain-containing protein n=2 Tax=Hirschia TaxID=2723 RepID=C6XI97_HIRBI|nr:hypothetical protein Hbal_1231 [Hirschia baltica ATCC 49814]
MSGQTILYMSAERVRRIRRSLRRPSAYISCDSSDPNCRWGIRTHTNNRTRRLFSITQQEMNELIDLHFIQHKAADLVYTWNEDAYLASEMGAKRIGDVIRSNEQLAHLPKSGFQRLVRQALINQGPLNVRLVQTAQAFEKDLELASILLGQVMDWGRIADIRTGRQSVDVEMRSAMIVDAKKRIQQIEQSLSARDLAIIRAACMSELTLNQIELKFGLAKRSAGQRIRAALMHLADVYDYQLQGGRCAV